MAFYANSLLCHRPQPLAKNGAPLTGKEQIHNSTHQVSKTGSVLGKNTCGHTKTQLRSQREITDTWHAEPRHDKHSPGFLKQKPSLSQVQKLRSKSAEQCVSMGCHLVAAQTDMQPTEFFHPGNQLFLKSSHLKWTFLSYYKQGKGPQKGLRSILFPD